MVTFGERVRELRNARKWTQSDLATKLGIDRTTISKWERQGGSEPDIATIATSAGVPVIPPKNLRSTHISLMSDFGIPLPTIQKQAGHSQGSPVTKQHYIRTYTESLRHSATVFHDKLHKEPETENNDLPNFAQ